MIVEYKIGDFLGIPQIHTHYIEEESIRRKSKKDNIVTNSKSTPLLSRKHGEDNRGIQNSNG